SGDPAQPLRAAAALARLPGIASARPLLARLWSRKIVPSDPLFKDQWHLRNTGQQGGKSGVDIRAVPAWDSATGAGVVIGIVDDGVEYFHPDLSPGHQSELSYDFLGGDTVALPALVDDDHGTAVAGLAVARGFNGLGLAGSAPSASFASLRLVGEVTTDEQTASAMAWNNDLIPIKNNSWGPTDASLAPRDHGEVDYPNLDLPEPLWEAAVVQAVTHGRDGLGTLFLFAAGNGQADGDQGSKDGYASLRQVIPVGAANNQGLPASFSEGGPHLVVTAPGDAKVGLATTDRLDDSGYNSTEESYPGDYLSEIDYTRAFVGTSASTPVASGVCALLLELRPDLGWRDVKEIFLRSSTKLQSTSRDWTTRPAGDPSHPIKHHPRHGGGLINALDALTLARDWTPLVPETSITATPLTAFPYPLHDLGDSRGAFARAFSFAGQPVLRVEHVSLRLDIEHSFRGDLEITLTSPSGVVSVFATATTKDFGADYPGYTFNSVRHWGEPSALSGGQWVLSIRDLSRDDFGLLRDATLTLHGTPLTAPAIVTPPEAQALATGSTLLLKTVFSGGNLSYQWTRNGKPLKGATSPTYRLEKFSASAAGSYVCVATNILGSASTTALVTHDDLPRVDFVVRVGATTEFDLLAQFGSGLQLLRSSVLPAGLLLDLTTGRIVGRPTRPGATRVVLTFATPDKRLLLLPVTVKIETLPAAMAETYVGLLPASPDIGAPYGGLLQLAVAANGRVTGTLTLGRVAHAFTGLLDGQTDEAATLEVALLKLNLRLALILRTDGGLEAGLFTTDLARPFASAAIRGRVSPWKTPSRPATALAGAYVVALHPVPGAFPEEPGVTPLTFAVTTRGRATWRLSPADGSPDLTGSVPLADTGTLYLHAPYATGLGALLGEIPIDTGSSSPISGGPSTVAVIWHRPAAPKLALPAAISDGYLFIGHGSGRHTPPPAGARLLDRDAAHPSVDAVVARTPAAEGALPTLLGVDLSVDAKNRFVAAAPNTPRLSLTYDRATGRITGSYTLFVPDPAAPSRLLSRVVRVQAVVLAPPHSDEAVGRGIDPIGPGSATARSLLFELRAAD
ncbi:MAG: S8 family serine peptidase, partial [Burkholderiales bacterium]|nr:S8 family serine peptidase [Opitutaceae bacterium]